MKELRIYRHGETYLNLENRFQGHFDSELTENGINMGKKLSAHINDINFSKFYVSPLKRAQETAKNVLKKEINIEFKEFSFGIWEGKTFEEVKSEYDYAKDWKKNPFSVVIPGGSDLRMESKRLRKVLCDILDGVADNGKVGVLTHGGIIRLLMISLLELREENYWAFFIDNCSETVFKYQDGKFYLDKFNGLVF